MSKPKEPTLGLSCAKCGWKGRRVIAGPAMTLMCPKCLHGPLTPHLPGGSRSKYRNVKTAVDGITFASKAEAECYRLLRARQDRGEISGLELQASYRLEVAGVLICKYVCDFRYLEGGKVVVADRKGYRTREYKLKRKLMLALHKIEILEL